ncbi:MAG: VacB/RNase II family 3'-5' exoribonuclease, partial [Calditrichaeota bacterium]
HIADVSYYVKEGGAIDKEAFERGNSVYLVDRVVPMLPERLSQQLCSLKEKSDRLTFSCIMELSPSGDLLHYRIAESVIRSARQFSYEEVQDFLDGKLNLPPELAEPLQRMAALARSLRRKRQERGSLDFDTPEAKVILDEDGFPIDIQRKETLESMRIIEEFMLMANKTVAGHIQTLNSHDEPPPFIYRVHEKPDKEKMKLFAEFVQALGYEFPVDGRISSKKLSTFIKKIRGTEEEIIIENVMLRSLMKARYDVINVGHFGLAFKYYTHFTSPIRRYADLAVHRMLKFYQQQGWHEQLREGLIKKLNKISKQASECEVVALEAERASLKMKQTEFMSRFIGDEFDGVISGVVHFGIFVEITRYLVEGLVHINDLDDDFYVFNEKTYTLTGTATGKQYRIGDPVRVKVVKVDVNERLIDFILVKKYSKKRRRVARQKDNRRKKSPRAVPH